MTKILTIDSSTEACSVALDLDGVHRSLFELAPRRHAELLLPMIHQLLSESKIELNELDAIGCCVGPGAFTGLRIAISVAQGLAYASNLPCIAISSLETMAEQAFAGSNAKYCLASIDARMKEVYFSIFQRDKTDNHKIFLQEKVIAPQSIDLQGSIAAEDKIIKVGTGWSEYQYNDEIEALTDENMQIDSLEQGVILYPDAKWMLPIGNRKYESGELLEPAQLQPVYLRNNVALKKSERK
jgi:tRNA threonylcarbamoyladenosine biosynthesis protein TsaB